MLTSNTPLMMKIWGVPFVLVGIYLIVGRYFVDARARARTRYGLTDTRIIVVGGILRCRTVSHFIDRLDTIDLTEHRDGTGTVHLASKRIKLNLRDWGDDFSWNGWTSNRLDRIPDARNVYQKIVELQSR